ncbi:hypothetical protein BJX61DRAFT_274500 [Aspergillus egyptiacus]|nr:hypothetical protein BJX61DRAFT_274500 [Aspergillus egyptiacus]
MSHLLTPPASRQGSETPEAELKQLNIADSAPDLLESLDTLLERYLRLLDKHQKLQSELASKLSSGFLSLAHANYTCPPGRRYGADYYDERMKATKRVALQAPASLVGEIDNIAEQGQAPQTDASSEQIFSIVPATLTGEEECDTDDKVGTASLEGEAEEPKVADCSREDDALDSTTESEKESDPGNAEPAVDTKPKSVKRNPGALDPIRWYGILVPPSLRSAQRSFLEAVEGTVPELASVAVEMQAAEKDISRLRMELEQQRQ